MKMKLFMDKPRSQEVWVKMGEGVVGLIILFQYNMFLWLMLMLYTGFWPFAKSLWWVVVVVGGGGGRWWC